MTFLLDLLVDVSILVRRDKSDLVLVGVVRDVGVMWLNIKRAIPVLLRKRGVGVVVYVIALARSVRQGIV